MEEAILQIRKGDSFTDLLAIMAFIIFVNWLNGANGFQSVVPPHLNPMGYFQPSSKTGSPSKSPTDFKITRPTTMPHQEFGNLTKYERRQLPHSKDMKISCEGHPKLTGGYW